MSADALDIRGIPVILVGRQKGRPRVVDNKPSLKEGYRAAGCCSPQPDDSIRGYFSHDNVIVVHTSSCGNLNKVEPERLISLVWEEIIQQMEDEPDDDYRQLDELDFRILQHHKTMGIDYSLMVASILKVPPQKVFQRHKRLRKLKLVKRVEKVMIRYRKGVVDNKWIKHRNHTYYEIAPKGERYLNIFHSRLEGGT